MVYLRRRYVRDVWCMFANRWKTARLSPLVSEKTSMWREIGAFKAVTHLAVKKRAKSCDACRGEEKRVNHKRVLVCAEGGCARDG